ncbi:MAG: hypothetical protein AMJ81_00045 [Phycisphaerae bacterium SM23_33]|nr:MAG: hypothetical protein AMS14_00835 [Planctomycetes bacterium DG_20]KPK86853.1 MAG: hypothetical protein AMJ81_00045 [Phycisphaerae bacterium SM23_33]
MAYATAVELRARIDKTSAADDATLTALIAAAERNINRACNRPDGFEADATASARIYAGTGRPYLYIDECVSVTLVEVKDSAADDDYEAWAAADWIACSGDPQAPDFNSTPYDMVMVDPTGDYSVFTSGKYTSKGGFRPLTDVSRGAPTCRITARWGFAASVPYDIKEAALMQSSRWYKRFQSAMSDVLASSELGTLLYRQSLDPDIRRLLIDGRYVKPTVGRR